MIYLITSGKTSALTTPTTAEFLNVTSLVKSAVAARIDLVQIREKSLRASVLYELSCQCAAITRDTNTKLLINDRADIAVAAGADGVHLTTSSLKPEVVRHAFGPDLLIGVSTHSLQEARDAQSGGADFIVFGPVFETASKTEYGKPKGVAELNHIASALGPFPVLALGGVNFDNVAQCSRAGSQGVAAIGMFEDPLKLSHLVRMIRETFAKVA